MVTAVTLPSVSAPPSDIGRVASSLPDTVAGVAVGRSLGVAGVAAAWFSGAVAVVNVGTVPAGSTPAVCASETGVTSSAMRPTRRPGCRPPPSAPVRPAAGAVCASGSFSSAMTRSISSSVGAAGLAARPGASGSGVSCTRPSCVVRITSPLWTSSPIFKGTSFPLGMRRSAEPHRPVTLPLTV